MNDHFRAPDPLNLFLLVVWDTVSYDLLNPITCWTSYGKQKKNVSKIQNQTPSWKGSCYKIEVLQQRPGTIKKPSIFNEMIMLPTALLL
jgi:hypothetical protein